MNLALFDFDGTITYKDTFWEFIKYSKGLSALIKGHIRLLPSYFKLLTGQITRTQAKQILLTYHYQNWSLDQFNRLADEFSHNLIDRFVRPCARKRILWHRQNNDRIVVVSASAENWLQKWCDNNHIELIGTRLEVKDGKLTGRLVGENCRGPEKVIRIKQQIDIQMYDQIYAYGDTSGDKEMLEIADIGVYRWKNI